MRARLAPGSTRDTDWQQKEYRAQMGEDAAERQAVKKGGCDCEPRRVRIGRAFRIVHAPGCRRFKAWMEQYQENAAAHASAAAHAEAIRRSAPVSEEGSP